MDIRPGNEIFGATRTETYTVMELVGSGAFGLVYKVRDQCGGLFALKTIETAHIDETRLRALQNEVQLAMRIQHKNVVQIHFFHDGRRYADLPPYMLMEYADGGTLGQILEGRQTAQKLFGPDELRAIFMQLAQGMKAINARLVHRDIKPDNILVADDVFKIADFGLSKVVGAATRSRTFKGLNHFQYCAPEAWEQEGNTPAMDMYSMGIVFYETAALRHPYRVESTGIPWERWKKAHLFESPEPPPGDPRLVQLIMKMIAKRPQDRYDSWDEVIKRLASGEALSEGALDVQSLVQRASENRRQAEQARLTAEEETRRIREDRELLVYCFNLVVSAARKIVEQFNNQSDLPKLMVTHLADLTCGIHLAGRRSPEVTIGVEIPPDDAEANLEGHPIMAWGFAKAPSGCGFNLLLTHTAPDDPYGDWHTFHVCEKRLSIPSGSRRREPFAFELEQLPWEIGFLHASQVYRVKQGVFDLEMLLPLVEELL